jgi:hypothetical protein
LTSASASSSRYELLITALISVFVALSITSSFQE